MVETVIARSRAVRFFQTGGPDVLQVIDVDEPHPGPGQVRVAVRAAGLNPFDSKVRAGLVPATLPRGQGSEFAGIIDEVSPDVTTLRLGDEVLGWTSAKAQADFVVVRATSLASKPGRLDWALAGGLGLVANTAQRAVSALDVSAGDTVLITGCSGGVGILAAQFARRAGATVVGTAREAHHDYLRELGVLPVSYGQGEIERLTRAASKGYTAALDTTGVHGIELLLALGVPRPRINSIAATDAEATYGVLSVGGGNKSAQELAEFAHDAAEKSLLLPIRGTYPIDRVSEAYDDLENGHGLGKIVLTFP